MKKQIILLIALSLMLALFAGCKGKSEEKKDTSSGQGRTEAASETVPSTEPFTSSSEETNAAEPVRQGVTLTGVNFRSEPNTDCEVIEVIGTGITVTVLGEENGFYLCEKDGVRGYLSMDYVRIREGETASSENSGDENTDTADAGSTIASSAYSGNGGVLIDSGLFPDVSALSNKSIPYGNDWEDKDANGLPNGVYYYESLYGKYYPVYRIKTDEKLIYLTFDEGYEAGYTPKILDILKEKNVKAVFFITKQFYDSDPELVKRMIDEGHIIGNHTCRHPSGGYPNYVAENGIDSFIEDVSTLHSLVYESFGYEMRLFRFPEGESSEMLMAELDNLGYTSVFWTYAHRDYVQEDQPEVSVTLNRCLSHLAPGSVYLLHAVSSSNTEALSDFIDQARAMGYDFGEFPVDEVSAR